MSHKTAMLMLADERGSFDSSVPLAEIQRQAIAEYLGNHSDELPEEGRDLLDDDLIANAGGDAEEIEV